jgi:hypothetical protein
VRIEEDSTFSDHFPVERAKEAGKSNFAVVVEETQKTGNYRKLCAENMSCSVSMRNYFLTFRKHFSSIEFHAIPGILPKFSTAFI